MINRKKLKLSLVSVPFSGHSKILVKLALDLAKQHPEFDLNFIITGWKDIALDKEELDKLKSANITLQVINDPDTIASADPMKFNFARTEKNVDAVIEACRGSDFVIYDFFAIEGYLVGKKLQIPAICSMPAIMGPFDPKHPLFQEGLAENATRISNLETRFNIKLKDKIEMVSDAFYLPSDTQNIIWSWEKFIKGSSFHQNRNKITTELFMRPDLPAPSSNKLIEQLQHAKKLGKKIIYLSLGTVVTKNLWDHETSVKDFVNTIFLSVCNTYRNNDQYEIVISSGRNPKDIPALNNLPDHFHVAESVDQVQVLREADLFITHAGGNSVNDAIDLGVPMIAIPFFGDQHICAENISNLKIGKVFLHPKEDRDKAINTHAKIFARQSFNQDHFVQAIEEVLHNPIYKQNIDIIKLKKPEELNTLAKALINRKMINWKEGDLLYGSSIDRNRAQDMTWMRHTLRMNNETPFSALFSDYQEKDILPRIVDQYNDVLKRPAVRVDEKQNSSFTLYKTTLSEFETFLKSHPQYLQPIGDLDKIKPECGREYLETLWNMCLGGIDFFTHQKKATIHFVIGSYNSSHSEAPIREINWIKAHWHDATIRNQVKFYYLHDGLLKSVDPVAENWFQMTRPTPTLTDVTPKDFASNQSTWKYLQNEIISTAKSHPRFFNNHLRSRYPSELKKFQATTLERINIFKDPVAAKQSLASNAVHIFVLRGTDHLTIIPKRQHDIQISHAVAAEDEPVICAGEVRMRRIQVNNQWLNVLDISNDSGHYRPTAEGLPKVIAAFEKLNLIVHRVNVVHTQLPETLDQVDKATGDFAPLTRRAII